MTDNHKPAVSVVMPVYNTENYLAEAIESILAQTLTDIELIIVDDASQDGSSEIMREYQRRDDRVRCLWQDRNLGVSVARNRGADEAASQIIAFSDSDDVSLPTRLEKQFRFLRENPEIGAVAVHSKLVNHDLSTLISHRSPPRQHALIVLSLFANIVALVGPALMIRRQPMRAIGGFNPKFRYDEEGEFFARLVIQTGIRFANLPEILYLQRQHDANKSSGSAPVADRQINRIGRHHLELLWDDVTDSTLARFRRLRHRQKLTWSDRRAAKRDFKRLIDTLIERQLLEERDKLLLIAGMNRKLEDASPRLWQKFCHWRRHNFGQTRSERNLA